MKRILFVDDEKQILDGLRRLLSDQQDEWDMQFAHGGEEALKLCQANNFQVVISDMRMPGMDGATLLAEVKALLPDAARLILSGYSDVALAMRSISVAHRVLTKPCDAVELRSTIENLCTLQDRFCTRELREVIGTIGQLPSLSGTYTALVRAAQDPNTSLADVAAIVEQDVAMAAKILQLVNSGFFGLAQSVTSIKTAVDYLGMDTIRNLALASEAFRAFAPAPGIPISFLDDMQRHAQRAALIVRTFPLPPRLRDTGVVAALLQDIGELVLACKLPQKFGAALALASSSGCSQVEAEEQLLGTSHAEIGAYLLGLWGINSLIVEAVAHHHHPSRIPHGCFDACVAVYMADRLARELMGAFGNARGSCTDENAELLEALGIAEQYPVFREKAKELFV
jgi:HD-like signal output (HDOD) protein